MLTEGVYYGYLTGEPILDLLAAQRVLEAQRLEKLQIKTLRQIEDAILTRTLWNLYRGSRLVKILEESAAQRQTLTWGEFKTLFSDTRIVKIVVYHDQTPVGIVLATNDLTALLDFGVGKWQSSDFYSQRFGEDLASGGIYFLLLGGFSQDLVSSFWAEETLGSIWEDIMDELKIQGGKFLVYDYSQKIAYLPESLTTSLRRQLFFGQFGTPRFLGTEVYRRLVWPPTSLQVISNSLTFILERHPKKEFWHRLQPGSHTKYQRTITKVFAWLEELGLITPETQTVSFEIAPASHEEITPELLTKIYAVVQKAFGGIPTHPDLTKQLSHNQRSPHRQMESESEFAKDLLDTNCRLFVGRMQGQIVFFCLFRIGLDERGEDGMGVGGTTCLNYQTLQLHLTSELAERKVAFILSIGMLPECQRILGNRDSLKAMSWMIDQVLPLGGVVAYDFALTINPTMVSLHRWLGLAKGQWWGLRLIKELCDRQVYEVIGL